MKKVCLFLGASFLALSLDAQIQAPAASPTATISQQVGLTDVKIEYSRPSAKGRKIYGELVPFGEVWRTGANSATKLTFSDSVQFNNKWLQKGTYALYTIPAKEEWVIIVSKNTGNWGSNGYKLEDDAVRFNLKSASLNDMVETFTINLADCNNNGAKLELTWENTRVSIPFGVGTDAKMMASIKSTMNGPSGDAYGAAARYYLESGKDMKQALEWMNKSLQMNGEKFWMLRQKALIQAKMGDLKGAIETATKSRDMAEKEKNMDYVRMNEKSIAEWKKM
jgi:tetratricopeptide (TPR) repeat protein